MASATPRQEGFLTILRKRNFLLLWLAQLISMTVLNASNYALIILVFGTTGGSTAPIGVALIFFSLPAVLFGAPAGVFVDRRNKRRVLFYSNCLRALVSLLFVVSLLNDQNQLAPIYLLTFLVSGIGQFFTPAEGASIPMLVSEEELMPALSLFQVTFMLSNALGLIILGPLLLNLMPTLYILSHSISPIVSLYAIMAVLYLVCAGLIALIPARNFIEPKPRKESVSEIGAESLGVLQAIWHEMLQAWTFIRRRPRLFESVMQLSFAGVLLMLVSELATPLVHNLLGLPSTFMSFIFAPAGIGLVLSSLFMPRITKSLGKARTILSGCIALAVMIALMPLTTLLAQHMKQGGIEANPWQMVVMGAIMFLAGVAINFINIPANTSMQEQAPEWIKGRVLALQLVIYNGWSIPAVLLIGWISDNFTLPIALYFLAACIALFGGWGLFYEHKPHPREHEEEAEDALEQQEPEKIVG